MANPYMVTPGNQFGQGLQALAGSVERFGQVSREREQAEQQRQYMESGKAALGEAVKAGDPAKVRDVMIQYPELQKAASEAFGFTNDQTRQVAAETYRRALSDPDNALQYMDQGIQQVATLGGSPMNMIQDYAMLKTAPDQAMQKMRLGYAALANKQEYDLMFGAEVGGGGGGIGTYNPRDYTTDSWAQFLRTRNPEVLQRYETSIQERLASDPDLTTKVADTQAQVSGAQAGAAEQAKSDVRAEMEPKIQAAVTAATEKAKRESTAVQDFDKKVRDAGGVERILDLADPLLDEATESWGGVALDNAGRLVGLSTKGAQAAAKLKILEASIVLNMPRMEGPQSNMDQMLYREAAAQIGNPTVPGETRRAAMQTIRDINSKYTQGGKKDSGRVKWGDL